MTGKILNSELWTFEAEYQDWFPFRVLFDIELNKKQFKEEKIPFRHYKYPVSRNEIETMNIPLIEVYDGK